MNDIDKVVAHILEIRDSLQTGELQGGEELTSAGIRLAAYKTYLGGYVAKARRTRDDLSARLDHTRATKYRSYRERMSIKDSENQAKLDCVADQYELNEASYTYERLRNLHNDVHDILDSIRNESIRLSQERGESRNAET